MKKATDPRHLKRVKIVQELFAYSFYSQQTISQRSLAVIDQLPKIDKLIEKAASEWPIDKIAKIDLAVLRLAIFELLIDKKEPYKVIIDEAVEIAKAFGNDKSPSFINGVLGTIVKLESEKNEKSTKRQSSRKGSD